MKRFTKLVAVLFIGALVGCGGGQVSDQPVVAAPRPVVTPPPVMQDTGAVRPERLHPDTSGGLEIPPAPYPDLSGVRLNELVRASPCDILPEYGQRVGTLAHPRGYPRWNNEENEMQYDSLNVALTPDSSVVYALRAGRTFENEVHDCQRLVVAEQEGLAFGALVGIFPLNFALRLPDIVFSVRPIPVATVYNWGDFNGQAEAYDPLGLQPEWNCLWLHRLNATGDQWRAAITNDVDRPCIYHERPTDFPLDVLRLHHPSDMPETARWGWDDQSEVQLLGVKCGSAWCWVGPPSQWQDNARELSGDPHITVPGWFDEQHLDLPASAGPDPLVPGPIAIVTPSEGFYHAAGQQRGTHLDRMTGFFRQAPDVAHIEIPGHSVAPPTYALKWGFRTLPVRVRMQVPPTGNNPWPNARSTYLRPDGNDGRSVAPTRISNAMHGALGSVRWRWHDTRSTVSLWSACGIGGKDCCDTN